MKTVSVLIGNSDDKLPQARWAEYVDSVDRLVRGMAEHVYFTGFSEPRAPWQNACWVFRMGEVAGLEGLRAYLGLAAREFGQESIALVVGETEFISPTSGA